MALFSDACNEFRFSLLPCLLLVMCVCVHVCPWSCWLVLLARQPLLAIPAVTFSPISFCSGSSLPFRFLSLHVCPCSSLYLPATSTSFWPWSRSIVVVQVCVCVCFGNFVKYSQLQLPLSGLYFVVFIFACLSSSRTLSLFFSAFRKTTTTMMCGNLPEKQQKQVPSLACFNSWN